MKMKMISPKLLVPAFLLFLQTAVAQDFANVDSLIKAYPASFSEPEKLADKINSDFHSEPDKARAIYTWIALNIHYDMNQYRANIGQRQVAFSYRTPEEKAQKLKQYNLDLAQKTLRSHKGVCQGYATLFDRLAALTGLESVMIPGTSKSHPTHIGKLPVASDHEWNAVKANGKWQFVDATWASGAVDSGTGKFVNKFNPGYFFTDPDIFFLNHYPDDEKWLLTDRTAQDFAALPLFYGSYPESGYRITFPKAGILPTGYIIPFKISNLKTSRIAYVFSNDNRVHLVNPTQNGTITEFDIPVDKKAAGYLTLYIGYDSVVTYKIGRS
jgi:hypothetical protein